MNNNILMNEQSEKILLTKNGLDTIRKKLDALLARRHEAIDSLRSVKDNNRDENGLIIKVSELETIETESEQLSWLLQHADIIVTQKNSDTVTLGCMVELKNKYRHVFYTIVSPLEMDVANNKISEDCILGKAVMNKSTGDSFEITTPRGTVIPFEVVSIN